MQFITDALTIPPKSRVELHIHLDGAIRVETLWELLTAKSLTKPGDGSLTALKEFIKIKEPTDLKHFLSPFSVICPAIQGDLSAIERIAREFVEDRSRDNTVYCEARFSPHLLLSPTHTLANGVDGDAAEKKATVVDDVLNAVLKGLSDGESNCPGTKVKLILCCMRGLPQHNWDVLRLCEEYKDKGVVGIDIAGMMGDEEGDGIANHSEGSDVFEAAASKGIHRTVHAGEDAGPESVRVAMEELKAERIGHGYRVVEDDSIYNSCIEAKMHFEVCPHSSYLTGAMKQLATKSKRHPVIRFAEDSVSFSISTDDPTITGTNLTDEYALLRSQGLTEAHLIRANFNAALNSFLPPLEKQALIAQLKEAYGVVDYTPPTAPSSVDSPVDKQPVGAPARPTITFNTWENRA